MNFESRFKASRSAQDFLERMSAIAKGWAVSSTDSEPITGEKIYIYCTLKKQQITS